MKRMDLVYQFVKEHTAGFSPDELLGGQGLETNEIADQLGMLRNNVSKELNELLRLDKIIKLKGRPVRFLDKAGVQTLLKLPLVESCLEVDSLQELVAAQAEQDPFGLLIGSGKSLKNQVEQAKAAIVYPPVGLHTLILGNTGVGKTLFARMMYNYGKYCKRFSEQSPFIIFNCADYYHNPQLLLSHLFGYIKGAFTGADQDREGLVEKADGGVLFLDEIHRLPPEGQEMLFYFIDTGTYNKLGETERKRKAGVLIIGATTEEPSSHLLTTFIRRIPVIIRIPSLQERTVSEKIDIIRHLFANEAHRVNKAIKISPEVVKALIGSVSYGNIGQLKSNIQITCAKGFLNSLHSSQECIELEFGLLSSEIKDGLFAIGRNHREFEELGQRLAASLVIGPEGHKPLAEDNYDMPFNLYRLMEDKIALLRQEGIDDSYINNFIANDVHINIKKLYNRLAKDKENRERMLKVIDKEILEFAEKMKVLVEQSLGRAYSERFTYALSFHLSAFFKRIKEKEYKHAVYRDPSLQIEEAELAVALQIKQAISQTFHIEVPAAEVTYIAILLKSVEMERQGQVGIIVAAHGNSTASSMVAVVERLLGEVTSLCAVDMPLDVSPKEILEIMTEKVRSMDKGKGVLLLVDMGSLFKFETTLVERTGSAVRTIDMVSTPLILEAVRKTNVFDMELEDVYAALRAFRGYNNDFKEQEQPAGRLIITVCASGSGTAVMLKEMVESILTEAGDTGVQVVPAGVRELDRKVKELQAHHVILAVVGVKRPKAAVPFIPLEKLINGSGERLLQELLGGKELSVGQAQPSAVVRDLCEKNLQQFLTFLNPAKVIGMLLEFVAQLEAGLGYSLENVVKIRLVVHVGYALERMLLQEGLRYVEDASLLEPGLMAAVDRACRLFTVSLRINLTEDEKYYICELLQLPVAGEAEGL